jgi:hypothetical protein
MAYNFLPCVRDQGFLLPPDLRLLIAPAKHAREGKPRKDGGPSASRSTGLRVAMEAKLTSPEGKARYKLRKQTIRTGLRPDQRSVVPASSSGAAWAPARPNGSFCVGPTTCSSSGVTP